MEEDFREKCLKLPRGFGIAYNRHIETPTIVAIERTLCQIQNGRIMYQLAVGSFG